MDKQVVIRNSSGGIGFAGLLTIVFITLKLTGVIDWSWIWVLCPIWLGIAIPIVLFSVILIIVCLCAIVGGIYT